MRALRFDRFAPTSLLLIVIALVSVACGAATGAPGAAGTDTVATSGTVPASTDTTVSTLTAPADTGTGASTDSLHVDSPTTYDFSKPLVMDGPGSTQLASTDDLKSAAILVPSPVVVSGLTPTAIFSFRDGDGVVQSFDDAQYGQFWFGQFLSPDTVTGSPDACVPCDTTQSGRVKLSDGETAVVWVSTNGDPSSIAWYSDGVEYLVMGPAKVLTRDNSLKIAELIIHSPRA